MVCAPSHKSHPNPSDSSPTSQLRTPQRKTTTARADTVAMRTIGRGWLAAILVVAIVVVMAGTVRLSFCDGPAPGWAENKDGCAEWSVLEYLYPWHWGVPDQCLGLCDSLGPG
jgi:hypothetical protein